MKRYFITNKQPLTDPSAPGYCLSPYHYIDLPGGGHVVVMEWDHCDPEPAWTELPHLLEAGATLQAAHATALAPLGISPTDSPYAIAKKLGAIHSKFRP